jgi:hypothetical protein
MGVVYKLGKPKNLVCQYDHKPNITMQTGTRFKHFNMSFKIFNGDTNVFYKVPIMDGMLDASNNALFTHISMVGVEDTADCIF